MAKEKTQETQKHDNECFIIMPIADVDGYDIGHFQKVYQDIFQIACNKAGYKPVRADEVKQTNLIHLDILQKLIDSPMAICDLSNRNPNVLFELGLRQAFDKPTVLVQEKGTPRIFDISLLRYTEYRKELKYREVLEDQDAIAIALKSTKEATDKGEGVNSIVNLLSLSNPASLKDVTENDSAKMLQIVMAEMNELRTDLRSMRRFNERYNSPDQRLFLDEALIKTERENNSIKSELSLSVIKMGLEKLQNLIRHDFPSSEIQVQYDRLASQCIAIIRTSKNDLITQQSKLILDQAQLFYSKYAANSSYNSDMGPAA